MASRTLQVNITGDARNINRVLDQTESRTRRWGGAMAKGFAVAGAAAAGGLAVGLKKSADAAIEAEKSQARLETQLRAAGVSWSAHRKQIDEVIQRHSQLSGLDDEDLQDSFTNIVRVTGDVNEALRLNAVAADIARARGMDVARAGELVGKVAGGNIGILSRYGIVVKDGATAQEALAQLQQKFAGQAEAYGKTTAGSLDRASVASENLGEIVGTKLTPWLAKGATALVNLVDKAGELGGPIRRATGTVRNAYDAVAAAVRRFMVRNREDIAAVIAAMRNLGQFAKAVFETIVAVIRPVLPHTRRILEGVIQIIRGLVRIVTGLINGDWARAWDGAKDVVSGAFRAIRGVIGGAWVFLRETIKRLGGAIVKGLAAALSGLGSAIKNAVISGVRSGVRAATGVVGDILGALNPFGDGIGKLAKSIGDGVGRSVDIPGIGGTGGLRGADPDLAPFAAIGRRFGLGVTSGIRPGDTTLSGNVSYHSSGDAIDMSGSMSGMLAASRYFASRFGGKLRELITPFPSIGIKDGRPYRYSGSVQAQHMGANAHVHLAYTGPFGDGIGQAAQAARAAGFRGRDLITAVAIAGAESRYDAQARNLRYPDHSIGMWQINQLAHRGRYGSDRALMNPFTNARAAWAISNRGRNWSPWSTFTSGDYRAWVDNAQRAVAGLQRRRGGGGGAGARGRGGGGGSGPVVERESATTQLPALTGPRTQLGVAGELVRAETQEARARAQDNLKKLITARKRQLGLKKIRLAQVRAALRKRIRKARRLRLLREEAQLVEEIDALAESIAEYTADQKGGAATITQAEALEAGVDTSAGEGGAAPVADNSAAIAELVAELRRTREFNERLIRTQGPAIVNAVVAAVNGGIGGTVGLGFQGIRSPVGSVAGL